MDQEWIARPYGKKMVLSDDGTKVHQIVVIEPGRNTGTGASAELLDNFGLVGHPGIFYEHIEHEGYSDGSPGGSEPSLKYVARSLVQSDKPREFLFSAGSAFYSVGTDESKFGYYHTLENISEKTIKLNLHVIKMK